MAIKCNNSYRMLAILWWSREYPVTNMAEEAEVTEKTACDIYNWLREVCSTKLLQMPMVLGGPGVVVQIDESLFKHKPKVSLFKCYNLVMIFPN